MGKDPAFLFYPNDWIGGTMGMTFEEKGAYIELLMMQFNRGHMTSHMVGQVVGQLWDKISSKFTKDADGNWYNERLESEINARKLFCNSRKNNLKGNNQYHKKSGHMSGHMTSHMENEDIDINENSKGKRGAGEKPSDDGFVIFDPKTLYTEFSNAQDWQRSILTSEYAKGLTKDRLDKYIIEFIQLRRDTNELGRSINEQRRHFIQWLRSEIKKSRPVQPAASINTMNAAEIARKNDERWAKLER